MALHKMTLESSGGLCMRYLGSHWNAENITWLLLCVNLALRCESGARSPRLCHQQLRAFASMDSAQHTSRQLHSAVRSAHTVKSYAGRQQARPVQAILTTTHDLPDESAVQPRSAATPAVEASAPTPG